MAELALNKIKLLLKNKPHSTEPFLLNLKKDKKLHIKSLPQLRITKSWDLIGRAVFEWVREVTPGLYY